MMTTGEKRGKKMSTRFAKSPRDMKMTRNLNGRVNFYSSSVRLMSVEDGNEISLQADDNAIESI